MLKEEFIKGKDENFKQTIIHIRVENKNFLRSAAALRGVPMYALLDEILTQHRDAYLKNTVNSPKNENQPKLE